MSVVRKLLGGLASAVLVAALVLFGVVETAELGTLDRFFRLRGPRRPIAPIVVVAIDEDSFDELNFAWPFPRALHGALLETIARGHPLAVGVDLIFPEPSVRGEKDDLAFGEGVTRAGRVVLGAAITDVSEGFYVKHDMNFPIPPIREGAAAVAPVNLWADDDSVVRRVVLWHPFGPQRLPGFGVALYDLARRHGLAAAPLPAADEVFINFRGGRESFPWVPYHRIVKGDVDPKVFEGKIVLVGVTSAVQHDVFATPFERGGSMPGVEIHANALDTLIRGDAIRAAPRWVSWLFVLLLAPLGGWLVVRLRALRAFAAVTAITVLLGAAAYGLFLRGVWWQAVGPVLSLVVGYGATSTESFIREQREKRRLSQFFSPDVLRAIVRHRGNVQLGSARRVITVFFSDLRGFTSISERLEPEQVAEMLSEYLSEMTEVVFRHGGTVDKYIGDCVMAIWNAPFDDPQHAANAVRTGLDFQERTLAVSEKWEKKLGVRIRNGVGINTGEAVVGTMGSRQRLEYTAIGDTVNLAARLESITKEYNTSIIISEHTYEHVKGQFMTRELGAVTVKGKTRPVKIYAVLPADIRRHPRATLDSAALVSAVDHGKTYEVRTRDISQTGMSLVGLPEELENGATIEIRCEGGGLPKPLSATGTIVWRRGDAAGVAFTAIEPDVAPAVSTYVATHDPR